MATNLLIYSSAVANSLASAYAIIKYDEDAGNTLTLKDLKDVATADVTTYCGTTLLDATYDNIYVVCPCGATSNSTPDGTINLTQQALLRPKLKVASQGTLSAEFSNATTHTTQTIGKTAAGFTADALIGSHVLTTGNTGTGQLDYISDNTTTVITIPGVFYPEVDATTDFKYISNMQLYLWGLNLSTTYITERTWAGLYPNNTIPRLLAVLGGDNYSVLDTTCDSILAGSISLSTASWVTNAYADMYVQIYSATTNGYQYAPIASNTGVKITLSSNWGSTPTGTPAFKVVKRLANVFRDDYIKWYILTYMTDLTDGTVLANYKRLVDEVDSIATRPAGSPPVQDLDFFNDTMVVYGSIIQDYVRIA